ncbi:DnaA/Hda family protein [Bifidobacterium aesculapii]|uniref:DnaA/Hda family protein n=1 Tax=Bifidobacterium aesculapii TaxID=1329411 RepID=UPI0006E2CE25|nr:DnaA/Hda family protein [Bifidobacterium aesculapii]
MSENIDPETHLDRTLTFDTFIPADCNRFARSAAIAVANGSGQLFNPLYIYGGSGRGKTHLLNATGNYAIVKDPSLRIRYVTAGEFTEEFSKAKSQWRTTEFNRCYRELDMLLVDDIQMLSGEDDASEQFRRTFCTPLWANKSVVVTAEVAPQRLDEFGSDLLSRLEAGLAVDVKAPDSDALISILRMHASNDSLRIPDGILRLIASSCEVPTSIDRFMEQTRTSLLTMDDELGRMSESLEEIRSMMRSIGKNPSK